ncbi:GNAT family N-acetyltransferase [Listeria sp. PSOL-1]|uniref:GNAT family N-acetyltransferase n=1 Tax=Listeria sp. PSOL-1 TaxID=1844999 RepID=UPI0013D85885|nr:GNAT family N-acetyltransferase [Listeria sp. PSOL-1]
MKIRGSLAQDTAQMIELEHLVWTCETTPAEIHFDSKAEYQFKNPPGSKTVAVIDKKIVGILDYKTPTPLKTAQHVILFDIAVHPDYQRQGIGIALINYLKETAQLQGFKKLQLRVLASNQKAIHFYKKNDFHIEGILKKEFCINGQYVDDIFMAYFL